MTSKTIIMLDGIDGSGKSMFAGKLRDAVEVAGEKVVLIRVDDFRRPVDWTAGGRPEAELYYDGYYDLDLCESCLRAFATGAPGITIPLYDAAVETVAGSRPVVLEGATIAIIEGVFGLRIPSASSGTVVYLDCSEAEARRRIIARDLNKGRSREEIERRIDQRYFPSQRRYREAFGPRERADIVLDNETPTAPRLIKRNLSRVPDRLRAIIDRVLPRRG